MWPRSSRLGDQGSDRSTSCSSTSGSKWPALELIAPRLRPGAIVIADNTASFRGPYGDYFAFLADPANRLRTMTLPFDGGLEMSVVCD